MTYLSPESVNQMKSWLYTRRYSKKYWGKVCLDIDARRVYMGVQNKVSSNALMSLEDKVEEIN